MCISAIGSAARARWITRAASCPSNGSRRKAGCGSNGEARASSPSPLHARLKRRQTPPPPSPPLKTKANAPRLELHKALRGGQEKHTYFLEPRGRLLSIAIDRCRLDPAQIA